MPSINVETASYIGDLDASIPQLPDVVSDWDDHIRLIKRVLRNQFLGESGNGYIDPITINEVFINRLTGLTSNAQVQLDELRLGTFPVGGITT